MQKYRDYPVGTDDVLGEICKIVQFGIILIIKEYSGIKWADVSLLRIFIRYVDSIDVDSHDLVKIDYLSMKSYEIDDIKNEYRKYQHDSTFEDNLNSLAGKQIMFGFNNINIMVNFRISEDSEDDNDDFKYSGEMNKIYKGNFNITLKKQTLSVGKLWNVIKHFYVKSKVLCSYIDSVDILSAEGNCLNLILNLEDIQ